MDKHFICLANSYKRGGRCVAGVEVTIDREEQWKVVKNEDGSPKWIRPIDSNTEYGEVPEDETYNGTCHIARNVCPRELFTYDDSSR